METGTKTIDPVCKMEVDDKQYESIYKGKQYCFCSLVCKDKFDENPEEYVTIDRSEMPA